MTSTRRPGARHLAALTTIAFLLPVAALVAAAAPADAQVPGGNGKIAFTRWEPNSSRHELWVQNADGSSQTRLSAASEDEYGPAWSPDGARIAFSSYRDGNREIYVMNTDGSGQTNVTNSPLTDELNPAWSPDGTKLTFDRMVNNDDEIFVMNADGSAATNLTNNPADDFDSVWSPDGGKIAFTSYRAGIGDPEIFVMNANGSEPRQLTEATISMGPDWSPDGSKIVFESYVDGDRDIFVINVDGSGRTNLTNTPGYDSSAVWSPDGSKIAFTTMRNSNNSDLWVMNANGTAPVPFNTDGHTDTYPAWQPVPPTPPTCAGRTATIVGVGSITGTAGPDVIVGSNGNDTINGLGGNDVICAGAGYDTITDGTGTDLVYGEDGNDTFAAGSTADGADRYYGGAGTDRVVYSNRTTPVSITLDNLGNDGAAGEGDNALVENAYGGKGNDVLTGSAGPNQLVGNPGNDSLNGLGGNDLLNTQDSVSGNDTADGGTGTDTATTDPRDTVTNVP